MEQVLEVLPASKIEFPVAADREFIGEQWLSWLKSQTFICRGFDLEQTRVTQLCKMDKLMALLAVASTWCLLVDHAEHGEANELPLLRHYRPEKSLFRLGLDALRQVLKNFFSPLQQRVWRVFLKLLSST